MQHSNRGVLTSIRLHLLTYREKGQNWSACGFRLLFLFLPVFFKKSYHDPHLVGGMSALEVLLPVDDGPQGCSSPHFLVLKSD